MTKSWRLLSLAAANRAEFAEKHHIPRKRKHVPLNSPSLHPFKSNNEHRELPPK
jgi:hypothetical protein